MITVLGSLNVDLVARVPRFPCPGETLESTGFRQECGGKGANQAAAAARMGQSVSLIGAVGADALGHWLLQQLHPFGIDTSRVQLTALAPTGTALILIDPSGQNQIILSPGANASITPAVIESHLPSIAASRALLVQLESPIPSLHRALQIARASGVLTVLNPAPAKPLDPALLQLCDWLIPNEHEASHLSGIAVHDHESARLATSALRHRFPRLQCLVTLGAMGAWLDSQEWRGTVPGFPVTAIDTVGAGDTTIGAFIAELLRGASVQESARFAMAAAALSVTRPGAMTSIPTESEVRSLITQFERTANESMAPL
jgi:ribokinase